MLEYLATELPSVQDLVNLNCDIPQIRRLYDIAKANPPVKMVRGQNAGDNSREWQDAPCGVEVLAKKPHLIDEVWKPILAADGHD